MNIRLNQERKNRAKKLGLNCSMIARNAIEMAISKLEKDHTGGSPVKKSTPANTPVKEVDQVVSTGR